MLELETGLKPLGFYVKSTMKESNRKRLGLCTELRTEMRTYLRTELSRELRTDLGTELRASPDSIGLHEDA